MKSLTVECRVSSIELIAIEMHSVKEVVKRRLAQELAHRLIETIELSEYMDCATMSKVIQAKLNLADDNEVKLLQEAKKFIKNNKEEIS